VAVGAVIALIVPVSALVLTQLIDVRIGSGHGLAIPSG
jgi:hypothetical protein